MRLWVRIPPGAGFISSLLYTIKSASLIHLSWRCNTTDFPIKICLAMQLEAKQALFARIKQKNHSLVPKNDKKFNHVEHFQPSLTVRVTRSGAIASGRPSCASSTEKFSMRPLRSSKETLKLESCKEKQKYHCMETKTFSLLLLLMVLPMEGSGMCALGTRGGSCGGVFDYGC